MIKKRTKVPKVIQQSILDRANGVCECCGKVKWEKLQPLQFHHIDDDATNHSLDNIKLLCVSCHGKTKYNKKDWIHYFEFGKFRLSQYQFEYEGREPDEKYFLTNKPKIIELLNTL